MIPTQFGLVPDVAFDEIKQIRNQQPPPPPPQPQQQPASLPFFAPTFVSTLTSPSINNPTTNDTLFLSSNQTRPTARDANINNSNNTRSRSLAPATINRPTVVTVSTSNNNSINQPPIFTTNKQTFSMPTRYGVTRLNPAAAATNGSVPPGPSSSQNSFISTRGVQVTTSPNIKRTSNAPPPTVITATLSNAPAPTTTTTNNEQRSHYETTYRASFIKPLVP